ncbi:MAG: hypothetical protein Q7T81_08110 [Pseudolabrys sp.]|nr:hypothetical protein [Pseudolabrys sp.]
MLRKAPSRVPLDELVAPLVLGASIATFHILIVAGKVIIEGRRIVALLGAAGGLVAITAAGDPWA